MLNAIPLAASLGDKIDSSFFSFDSSIFTFFGNMQNGFLTVIAKFFTAIGDEKFMIPFVLLAAVLCLFKRTRKYGFAVIFAMMVGTLLTNLWLKPMVLRIRPYNTMQTSALKDQFMKWYAAAGSLSESDYSFPSGHTTSAFEVATALVICLVKGKKGKFAWILPLVAIGTMCSRVYLMVHYPTDVIAGALVGTLAGVIGYLLAVFACYVAGKVKFLDAIDLEKLFKKGINLKACGALFAVATLVLLGIAFGRILVEKDEVKCAYSREYDCQNKARVGEDKYPAIDGENYCKIHWKQITAEKASGVDGVENSDIDIPLIEEDGSAEEISEAPAVPETAEAA